MTQARAKIRLFVGENLAEGATVALTPDQARYLFGVMRLGHGDTVLLFNGRDGEWLGRIEETGKKGGTLSVGAQMRDQTASPDLWLCFAPLKKASTDFVVEKSVELGVSRIQPVFTRYTNAERVRTDRVATQALEAAEQCGRLDLPDVGEPVALDRLIADWDPARRLMLCDEARTAPPAIDVLAGESSGPWAILIGPEGGFAPEEIERLSALPYVRRVSLGPRILRANTAAAAALTVWQSVLGDWRR